MMELESPGLKFYADKLNDGEPFSFIRYGNGEWDCIMELYHRTRSGSQKFSPSLRNALTMTLTDSRSGAYFPAMQSLSFLKRVKLLPRIEPWLAENAPGWTWHNGEVFTKASMHGRMYPLVKAMQKHRVVVVGPKWLIKLPFASTFVPVSARNCWTNVDAIERRLRDLRDVVISFSAGPATKVLIHRLQPTLGEHSWMIDFGSVWDPYCGVKSRNYHGRVTPEVQRRNLRGEK